jgi:outer membrane protein assembly factor BamB
MTVVGTSSLSEARQSDPQQQAERILQRSGVEGGLIVHVGCGDGKLTAALRATDSYLVHGLDTDAEDIRKARQQVQSLGLYGQVSVERFDGKHLPYVDKLVNLVVSEKLGDVAMDEVMRVLCPNGVAYIRRNGQWTKTVKPRPSQIDEWTHFLYDATNNAVSDDSVVGPPRQLQWVAGPQYARSHDHLASVSAAVAAGGRIFYIVDEGPIAAVVLQPQWKLVARDAFSGVLLWSRQIPKWQWHLRGFRSGPSDMARRLVAVGDKVYVTLQIEGPLSALNAATGRTIRTYKKTQGTLEVVYDDGTLFVVVGETGEQQDMDKSPGKRPGFARVRPQRPAYPERPPRKRIVAIDAKTGRVLWSKSDAGTHEVMPTTLAVSDGRVFFQNADDIICLDARSGEDLWRAERPVSRRRPTWSAPTLVVYGDVVLSADRAVGQKSQDANEPRKVDWIVSSAGGQAPVGELIAFSAEDGQRLWSCECRECYNAPVDVLVADGLVWTGDLVRAKDPGFTEARNPRTGQITRTRPQDQTFFAPGMGHGRCHRNRATNQYLVLGRSGVEFIDLATGKGIPHHWVRGTCQYGVMPCNGLLYAPPHSCACFITAKLKDFNCLAPARKSEGKSRKSERLQKGPAYEQLLASELRPASSDSWPTYRHDAARSGYTPVSVTAALKPAWRTQLGGRLSSIAIAEDKLFVAQVDAHTVHALDAGSGTKIWSHVAGGRIDSPPTIWQGRVLFGCADGWAYCLRSSDGALAWRFRAAPQEQRIVAYGQLESLWPVHGSVLVHDDIVYCAAGRSSYLDGGIRLCRLDVKTGRLLSQTPLDDRDPQTGYQRKGVVHGTNMPGALPDILSCDGESIYMRHSRFDLAGRPQAPEVPHLFSAAGFLDDAWWHRTYWLVGTAMGSNYGGWPRVGNRVPAGRLLVLDDSFVYGFGRNQYIHHGAHVGIDGATIFHYKPNRDAQRRFTYYQAFAIERESSAGNRQQAKRARQYRWTQQLPVLTRAMVLAGDSLLLAGPPDIFSNTEPATALEGNNGGLLIVVSAAEGRKLAQCDLDSPPVFDGMAAAQGRVYLATVDGSVVCLCPDK